MLKETNFIFNKFTKLRFAAVYAIIDKDKEALTMLTDLQKSGIFEIYFTLRSFPGFDNLRNNPEFKAIVKRIDDEKAAIRAQVRDMEQRGELHL